MHTYFVSGLTGLSQSFGQGGFVGGSLTGLNSSSCNTGAGVTVTSTPLCPSSGAGAGTMTSSALAAVTQMSMSNTSNMYNGVDHMSSHQGHHQQQQQQQQQQQHHAAYMAGAQGFFQDRNDLAEASIKGNEKS